MGYIQYKDVHFHKFLENTSLRYLSEYGQKINSVLKNNSERTNFSPEEFIQFAENYYKDKTHFFNEYRFTTFRSGREEEWSIKTHFTQISFLEGGIISYEKEAESRERLAKELLEQGLADQIVFNPQNSPKKDSLLPFSRQIWTGKLAVWGNYCEMYLWDKLHTIMPLGHRLLLPVSEEAKNNFPFFEFAEEVKHAFTKNQANEQVRMAINTSLFYLFNKNDDFSAYIKQCDEKLKNELSPEKLEQLFSKIEIDSRVWFKNGLTD